LLLGINFAAIIIGLIAGLYFVREKSGYFCLCTLIAVAIISLLCAIAIPHEKHVDNVQISDKKSQNHIIIIIIFIEACIVGALLFLQVSFWTIFHGTGIETLVNVSSMLIAQALGMAAGCLAAVRLSRRHVELGLVPLGFAGMIVCPIFIFYSWTFSAVLLFSALFCASAGLAWTPVRAYQMQFIEAAERCLYFAVQNRIIVKTIIFIIGFSAIVHNIRFVYCFWSIISVTFLFALVVFWREPRFLWRLAGLTLSHTLLRVRTYGEENIPEDGPALLVANHVSFVDALLISLCTSRPVHFMMHETFYRYPLLYPFVKWAGFIEVPAARPKQLHQLFLKTHELLRKGEIVCVFPEGGITHNGIMMNFRKGISSMIPADLEVPVIPVRLGALWGSIFTHYFGKVKLRIPPVLRHPASITIGRPMSKDLSGYEIRLVLSELAAETERIPDGKERPLHSQFAWQAKRHPFRKLIKEFNGTEQKDFRNFQMFVKAVLLSREIRRLVPAEDKYVGVMLPNCAAAAVSVLAVMMADKVPALLNFTASRESGRLAVEQAGLHCILTSKIFLSRLKMEPFPQMAFLEEIAPKITKAKKIQALLAALLIPRIILMKLISPLSYRDVHRTGVVIFSSGSTGIPKGIMLSHHNINSDLFSFIRIMNWRKSDKVVGNLPVFHSFGLTTCLWLPIVYSAEVVYIPNPLDAQAVGQAIRNNKLTVLMATPGFLQTYMRRCEAKDFAPLRLVISGAEKLRNDIADKFQEMTGLAVAEGYGCSELSPVVSINVANSVLDLGTSVGKRGSIGTAMPGICAKIVDPETFELKPPDTDGLLVVKGPTVMQGYLNDPVKTAEVIRDGWYLTGDIAHMNDRGYITITGRLSRFSKIAGEMVPHELVEKEINEIIRSETRCIAVCGAEDVKKGEKLVVIYSDQTVDPQNIVRALRLRNLPNLWIPRPENFYYIQEIPMLGSGKLDFTELKKLAAKLAAEGNNV
jgi:acyl-[acyl-carrier-protein]-phospholipid O-acyltransferase/long-chain-fatty-acid--[acyl-carrier-protein] ligase